jgi:hypothetical protein
MNLPKLIRVKKIDAHIRALYELLKNRKFNISNQILPDFNEHKSFVLNNPYRAWYLVEVNNLFVGTVYLLKDNCVGIYVEGNDQFIIKKIVSWILENKKPLPAIKSVRAENFHVNLAFNNKVLSSIFQDMGADPIQVTYLLKNL